MLSTTDLLHSGALASPLRRPKVARAVSMTIGGLLLLAAVIISLVVGGSGVPAASVFLRALTISSALAVLPVAILWYLDRRERESPWLFAAAFLWGGLIATTLAMPINTAIIVSVAHWLQDNAPLKEMLGPDAPLMIGAPLAAPIVEETTKGIGILLLFWLMRSEFDNVRDGFIYGALVGAGFNWFESAMYVQQNFVQYGTATYGFQLGVRYAWLGLAGHALFSGLFGASLGLARATRSRAVRYLAPIGGFLIAMAAHFWNNSLPLFAAVASARAGNAPPTESLAPPDLSLPSAMLHASVQNLVIFLPFVLLLVAVLRRSGNAERTVIREELADEVGTCVTPQEYQAVVADSRFRTRRIDGGNRACAAALVNAQNELAFRKRRLKDRGFDPQSDLLIQQRRDEIARLRATLNT